jgi:hypothetical protein
VHIAFVERGQVFEDDVASDVAAPAQPLRRVTATFSVAC